MRIIPAIDIIEGRCVRLTKGDYSTKKNYDGSPLEMAKSFEGIGIQYLHLVDLEGAKSHSIKNHKVLEEICVKTSLKVQFGGGIKTNKDIKLAFDYGANQIIGGSIAIKSPEVFEQWIEKYGSDKIILGADTKQGKIAYSGWTETENIDIDSYIKHHIAKGIKYVICTDIAKDGMLEGPSISLYGKLLQIIDLELIASGGVSNMDNIKELKTIGCEAVIIGKAIYEGKITLKELKSLC